MRLTRARPSACSMRKLTMMKSSKKAQDKAYEAVLNS